MRPQLIMFAYGIFIVGTLMCLIGSGAWFSADDIGLINSIANLNSEIQVGVPVPTGIPAMIDAIGTIITWNYPFLSSPWGFVLKCILLFPVSIGVVIGLLELLATIISGIIGAVRSLLGGI